MSLRRPATSTASHKSFRNSLHVISSAELASIEPPKRVNHRQLVGADSGWTSEDELKLLKQQVHQLEMEAQRLRLELQRRPTQKEHSDQREEMQKVEQLFAQGSQENEKLMMRMKEKEDREKNLDRALCRMLGQDWPAQLGVSQPTVNPSVDFESTPLPAQRFIRSNLALGHSVASSLSVASPATPVSQTGRPRGRQPSPSFTEADLDSPLVPAASASGNELSSVETQQLLRLLLAPHKAQEPTIIETGTAIEPELIQSFIEHLEDCREQLAEQERRGSAREARIRTLIDQAKAQTSTLARFRDDVK